MQAQKEHIQCSLCLLRYEITFVINSCLCIYLSNPLFVTVNCQRKAIVNFSRISGKIQCSTKDYNVISFLYNIH